MAGTNVWWGHAEDALLQLVEQRRIPVLMNGMARGTVPADHPLAFSRARSKALGEADVAVVVGVPMDFRLGFGAVFGQDTQLIVADRVQPEREHPRPIAAGLYGDLSAILTVLSETPRAETPGHEQWVADLRATEIAARSSEQGELADDRSPLHPMRVYAELAPMLDRDAIVVVDAGDFGSYAGRVIDSYVPGAWLDSGPFGCLGSGPGYALAAKLARPDRQVVVLQGDGAFGFSGMEWDTLVRHNVPVVSVIGNNGIWAPRAPPDEGAVRLLGGGRAATRHPLRRGRARARRTRRAGLDAGRAAPGIDARPGLRPACRGQRADRSRCCLSAPVESGMRLELHVPPPAQVVPPGIVTRSGF